MKRKIPAPGDGGLAVALIRCSKEDQDLSPAAQTAAINRWATAAGITIASWHEEFITGDADVEHRYGLLAALVALEACGAGFLVVAKRDRFARNVRSAAIAERMVKDLGAVVVCANGEARDDGSEFSDFMRTIIDAVAAYERARIAMRTTEALAVKKSRGERVGQIPYGMRLSADGKHLEPVAAQQEVIELVNAGVLAGKTLEVLRAELAGNHPRSRSNARWRIRDFRRMLRPEVVLVERAALRKAGAVKPQDKGA